MCDNTDELDFLTNGFRLAIKDALPFFGCELEVYVYSCEIAESGKPWVRESGMGEKDIESPYIAHTQTEPIYDSRTGKWTSPKYVLWKICTSDTLQKWLSAVTEEEKAPLYCFMDMVLAKVAGRLEDCKMFESLAEHDETALQYLLANVCKADWLFRSYADGILKAKGMPEQAIITQLSAQMYERRPICGTICFMSEEEWGRILAEKRCAQQHKSKLLVLNLEGIEIIQRYISIDNMRILRKLMEMNTPDTCLTAVSGPNPYITGMMRIKDVEERVSSFLEFDGHLMWHIRSGHVNEIKYNNGTYHLQLEEDFGVLYKQVINELGLEKKEDVLSIIEILKNEKHGTSIVFMDQEIARGEAWRLHKMNRCIVIEDNDMQLSEYLQEMKGISAIDGAMIADLSGRCYALGAILDGEVIMPGKVSRGARYNSVTNYVNMEKFSNAVIFGVIVSEDRNVDVVVPKDLRG